MTISSPEVENTFWTAEVLSTINMVSNCIGVNIVCAFGVVGNTINTVILYRHGFKDSTNILLFSLSISDLVLVITLPIGRLHCLVSIFDHFLAVSIQTTATVTLLVINRSLLFASLAHVGMISLERFVAIFFPFHVSRVFTIRRMRNIVICIYVINFLMLTPWFGAFSLDLSIDPSSNKTIAYAHVTEFYSNNEYELNLYGAVTNFFTVLLNLFIVTVCCSAIAIKLCLNTVKRSQLVGQGRSKQIIVQNAKISRMLLTICCIFYVIFFPTTVLDLYLYFTISENLIADRRYVAIQYISDLVYCINSSINFLVYVTMSSKYYKTYLALFRCGKQNKSPKRLGDESETT